MARSVRQTIERQVWLPVACTGAIARAGIDLALPDRQLDDTIRDAIGERRSDVGGAFTRTDWQVLLQSGRLKIAADLLPASTLTSELPGFRVRINLKTGHDSNAAGRDWHSAPHYHLVLTLELACCHSGAGNIRIMRLFERAPRRRSLWATDTQGYLRPR